MGAPDTLKSMWDSSVDVVVMGSGAAGAHRRAALRTSRYAGRYRGEGTAMGRLDI
jgi:hypothetical protein